MRNGSNTVLHFLSISKSSEKLLLKNASYSPSVTVRDDVIEFVGTASWLACC